MFEPEAGTYGGNAGFRADVSTAISTKRAADALERIEKLLQRGNTNSDTTLLAETDSRLRKLYVKVRETVFPSASGGASVNTATLVDQISNMLDRPTVDATVRKETHEQLVRLFEAIRAKHFPQSDSAPNDVTSVLITQIDHLIAGLVRTQGDGWKAPPHPIQDVFKMLGINAPAWANDYEMWRVHGKLALTKLIDKEEIMREALTRFRSAPAWENSNRILLDALAKCEAIDKAEIR